VKFSICNETYQGWDWERCCQHVADTGYDGIEIAPFTLDKDIRNLSHSTVSTIRSVADKYGLDIVGLHWLLVSPEGLSMTSDDSLTRNETSDFLVSLVKLCSDLNGTTLVLGSPKQRRLPLAGFETAEERFLQTLTPALEVAQENGIDICIEPLPAPEADFILTLDHAAKLSTRSGFNSATTILDVKSASSESDTIPDLIKKNSKIITHVHANDANRRGPGFGDVDFVPILRALTEIQYTGYVSVEVFDYTPDPETIARESLSYLRQCLKASST